MSAVALDGPGSTFTDRIFELLNVADFRRADSDADREEIFRLRYSAYLAEGGIAANFEKRFTDPYDDLGNAWIFGVYIDDKLASSIRINVATKDFADLPSLGVFPEFLMPELEAGKIIVDPTRHAVDRDAAARYPGLVYMTMRLGWMAAAYFNADILLAAVRSEHQAFYRRVGGHRVVCPARPYPLLHKPISLMTLDYQAGRGRVEHRYPFFRSTNFERRMLFERLQGGAVPERAYADR
ncbi:MAG: hypothetical protein J0H63_10375, partial [Rhizobiales bacterium]|nr:hypothetical protein [Hyphomicrobiales bacterium]